METLNNIDLLEVKLKLYERLKPSGWGDKLKTFLLSEDMDKILSTLYSQAREGKRFTPVLKQVFRAFEECPYDNLKVVILGQDPYPQPLVADGVAFSCSNTNKAEASLRYINKELEDTVYPDGFVHKTDLKHWCNQGILPINTALTTTVNKVGQHYELWQPFLAFLFDTLTINNPGLVYVFMGKKAQEWMESIPDNNYKLTTTHPASAAYLKYEKWDSGDIFRKVSDLVFKNYKEKITW